MEISRKGKKKQKFKDSSLLEYALFSVHIILLPIKLPEII
jgi:hypothetical protein